MAQKKATATKKTSARPLSLLVATRKGAFILKSDAMRRTWKTTGPLFLGQIVHHMVLDPRDGRTLRHHTPDVRGTPQNPMTRDEVDEKCFALIEPRLGRVRARRLCNAIWQIEKFDNLRRLRRLLQA